MQAIDCGRISLCSRPAAASLVTTTRAVASLAAAQLDTTSKTCSSLLTKDADKDCCLISWRVKACLCAQSVLAKCYLGTKQLTPLQLR